MVLTYLFFEIFSEHNSEFIVLCLKVAICAYATGFFCVCYFARPSSVTYTHTPAHPQTQISVAYTKFCEQNSGLYGLHTFLYRFDNIEITLINTYFQFHCPG